MKPGIYELDATGYHADQITDTPTLSASIANILIGKSPAHAKAAHPKLNPNLKREESDKFDIGTCAHELLLRGVSIIDVIDAKDWRTNDAKVARLASRNLGRIPLLPPQAEAVQAMVKAANEQLFRHAALPPLFEEGKPEQTLVWEDDHGVICRARLDWLHDDFSACDDLKTTSRSADPAAWSRSSLFKLGHALQARFYQRGVKKITGVDAAFRFAVVETDPPYALSVVSLAPSAEAIADAQIETALATWAMCLEQDVWPSYTSEVAFVDAPAWVETDWLEREEQVA